jgi:hypothetical protein
MSFIEWILRLFFKKEHKEKRMSNGSRRFMFAGHAIGASARFHRLDDVQNLNHVVPTLGSSVLSSSGGRCESRRPDPFRFEVTAPRQRCLMSVESVDTMAEGSDVDGVVATEVMAEVVGLEVVEKLRCDLVRMHMLVTRTNGGEPVVTTQGNRIEGLRMGDVKAVVTIDEAPLLNSSDSGAFETFLSSTGRPLSSTGESVRSTIVSNIELIGSDPDITVEGNTIVWHGFGRIILGEIDVKGHDRRLSLVRLEMGSDAGGSGGAGEGHTNGTEG